MRCLLLLIVACAGCWMPTEDKVGLQGLATNIAETQAPPGTLIEAENVVMRRPGCIEPRDGLQLAGTLSSGFAAYGFSWRSKDFILRNNGSNVFDWRDTAGGTYQHTDPLLGALDPQPMRRDIFSRAEARASLYVPYDAGVLKMDTDAGPWEMTGIPLTAFFVVNTVAGSWLPNNEHVAYRIVCRKTDANGLVVSSIPTGRIIVANTTGGARAVQIDGASYLSTSFDYFEIYRGISFPTSSIPDDEMQLVATVPAAANFTYIDTLPVAQRGKTLYTSPSRGGIDERNDRPPAAAITTLFRGSLFFGNIRGPKQIQISNTFQAALGGSATGVGRRTYTGTTTNGSNQLTLMSSTVGLEKGMRVSGTNIPSLVPVYITNIVGATVTISENATGSLGGVSLAFDDAVKIGGRWTVANELDFEWANDSFGDIKNIQVWGLTPPQGGYARTYVIEAVLRNTASQTIQATHGSEYSPPLPNYDGTPLELSQDVWPGGIRWSKPDEPEHVRPIDNLFIGDQAKAVLGFLPTRDALFIVKEDGVFRLTGANGSWRVDPFDPTARCVLPSSIQALRGRGVFLGDRGVAMVSDDGVEMISAPVNDQVKLLIDQIVANWPSTGFYELSGMAGAHTSCVLARQSEYTLARGSTVAPLVYNDITGAWTTLAYYGHPSESLSYKALFDFERSGHCVLSMGRRYFKTLLSTEAGADYMRSDRADAVSITDYAGGIATLAGAYEVLTDDILVDHASRHWRATSDVGPLADEPLELGAFATYRGDAVEAGTNFDWVDRTGNGHTLRQATGAAKPTIVNPSEIGARPALRFDGVDDYLAAIDVASNYTFLHNGTGSEVHIVTIPRGALVAAASLISTYLGGAAAGYQLLHGGVITTCRNVLTDNAGAFNFDANATLAFALDTPVRIATAYLSGGSPERDLLVNAVSGASGADGTAGTNAPGPALNVGRRPNGTSFAQHDIAEIVIFNRVLTAPERARLNAYFVARYSATTLVPVQIGGSSASLITGAGVLHRSLRCKVMATGFAQPQPAEKRRLTFKTTWATLVGPVALRYAYQSSMSAALLEEDADTTLVRPGEGDGVANYQLGADPKSPAGVPVAHKRSWLLRARIRWAMAQGYAQLEGIHAAVAPMEENASQQVVS